MYFYDIICISVTRQVKLNLREGGVDIFFRTLPTLAFQMELPLTDVHVLYNKIENSLLS